MQLVGSLLTWLCYTDPTPASQTPPLHHRPRPYITDPTPISQTPPLYHRPRPYITDPAPISQTLALSPLPTWLAGPGHLREVLL